MNNDACQTIINELAQEAAKVVVEAEHDITRVKVYSSSGKAAVYVSGHDLFICLKGAQRAWSVYLDEIKGNEED